MNDPHLQKADAQLAQPIKKIVLAGILLSSLAVIQAGDNQTTDHLLRIHPANPRYFLWHGRTTVLVASGEHYGSVMNLDFDYQKYLATLQAEGLNHTRLFLGDYVERAGAFGIADDTIAPAPGRLGHCALADAITNPARASTILMISKAS